jgi:hypothetical protein
MKLLLTLAVLGFAGCQPRSARAPSPPRADTATTIQVGSVQGSAPIAMVAPSATVTVTATAAEDDEADAIREAALRYMMTHNASGQGASAKVLCIAFSSENASADPPDAFLKRFTDSRIKATSKCSKDINSGVKDRGTGVRGIELGVGAIHRVDSAHVTIEGGYYEGGLSASGNTYTLEKKSGRWTVTKNEMHWVS